MTSIQAPIATPVRPRLLGGLRSLASKPASVSIPIEEPAVSQQVQQTVEPIQQTHEPIQQTVEPTVDQSDVDKFSTYLHDTMMKMFVDCGINADDIREDVDKFVNESRQDLSKLIESNTPRVVAGGAKVRRMCKGMCFAKAGEQPKPCHSTIVMADGYCKNHNPETVARHESKVSPKNKPSLSPLDAFLASVDKTGITCQCTKADKTRCLVGGTFIKPYVDASGMYYVVSCSRHNKNINDHIDQSQIIPEELRPH